MLQVSNLTKYFGGLAAVNDLSFGVEKGEIVGLVGPNGAGKTTVLNLITGFYQPSKGNVTFEGRDITGKKPSVIAALGLTRSFQSSVLFDHQTCLENMLIAHHLQRKANSFARVFGTRSSREEEMKIRGFAEEILERVCLVQVNDQLAGSLPLGSKRVLGMAVVLATNPKMVLLDEPVAGMGHAEIQVMKNLIEQLKDEGLTFILVEHNMRLVMDICDRIVVLNFGVKLAEGTPREITSNRLVIDAYTGGTENRGHAT